MFSYLDLVSSGVYLQASWAQRTAGNNLLVCDSSLVLPKLDLPPGCAFYLSSWQVLRKYLCFADFGRYRRYELSTRFALLYTSVPVAGAVSGLLANVITQYMDGAAGFPDWRWLFVSSQVVTGAELIF